MKETSIIFNTEMVKAYQKGRKTQTRRLTGLKKVNANPDLYIHHLLNGSLEGDYSLLKRDSELEVFHLKCPFGKPGDLIWVRETWAPALGQIAYKADYSNEVLSEPRNKGLWRPSIHMPKTACRYWLEIVSIRLERWADITEADAKAEGISPIVLIEGGENWKDYHNIFRSGWDAPIDSFKSLWISIYGLDSWYANPWVWRIEFKPFQP